MKNVKKQYDPEHMLKNICMSKFEKCSGTYYLTSILFNLNTVQPQYYLASILLLILSVLFDLNIIEAK